MRDTVVTIVMVCKNGEEQVFTSLVKNGKINLSEEKLKSSNFQFEMLKKDCFNLMTDEAYSIILMATGKMKMTKDT